MYATEERATSPLLKTQRSIWFTSEDWPCEIPWKGDPIPKDVARLMHGFKLKEKT